MPAMDIKNLIDHFGTVEAAKKATGTSRQLWDNWTINGIPRGKQFEFEVLTAGKLKADRRFWKTK